MIVPTYQAISGAGKTFEYSREEQTASFRRQTEEAVEGSDLYLGRTYMQAPEVDGLIVLNARA